MGRCLDDFEKRISREYGHIYPSDCHDHGQQTNCHINHELNEAFASGKIVEIGILEFSNNEDIIAIEKAILDLMRRSLPYWNINY